MRAGPSVVLTSIEEVYKAVNSTNAAFVEAETFKKTNNYANAIESYQKALAETQMPEQRGLINLYLARATEHTPYVRAALKRYKRLAADAEVPNEIRAYAIEFLGRKLIGAPTVLIEEVFTGDPYSAMHDARDKELSLRRLFDYGNSLFPLAFAEFQSANWYANHVLKLQKTAPDAAQIQEDMAIIEEKLKAGDKDLVEVKPIGPMGEEVFARGLLRKAMALSTLSYAGYRSAAEAEDALKAALNIYKEHDVQGESDGPTRWNYARFLAKTYGASRSSDIHALLQPLYAVYSRGWYSGIAGFFRNSRTTGGTKADIKILASLDQDFKTYLLSLGWSISDFI